MIDTATRKAKGSRSGAKKKKASAKAPEHIEVRMGRLGAEVKTYFMEKGQTVSDVLNEAGLNGDVTTCKINGRTVPVDTKLTRNVTIVAIGEMEGGNGEDDAPAEEPASE